MGLSRLDNFLKSSRGTILYVNPNDLDATDSIENQGNSLTRPFKTIQRALIEAARFSYQRGLNNDRFSKTTILLYPGDHIVDNRPGFIPDGLNNYQLRNGTVSNNLPAYDLTSNFDLSNPDNELYKLNSIHGGVILPRGTSIVGLDLRKTKIRPKYVPDPENDNIERSCIFRVTGTCYLWQFSLFDADPNSICYKDYTTNTHVPNFSHHKLTCFEYADGVNNVSINDEFLTANYGRTDLDMYYEKISLVYGQSSGRAIEPDYPSSGLDIQPKIDEYRIVGSTGLSVGISSIKAGDGSTATTSITVTTESAVAGLDVDTPFRVEGIADTAYNGQFVVAEKLNSTQIIYKVQNAPVSALPSVTGATLSLQSDTITSASPYIFNISLRSVYGMCGLLADGAKATGFKSMVVAQFTGIGLQKDDNAFVKYSSTTGTYNDSASLSGALLSNDSRSVFKPTYRNFHIKATNNAFIQCVSVFAIGYAEHFAVESGGDMSITNSNSNFGAKALVADGFRSDAYPQDDTGYITHVIPPKEIPLTETSIEFSAIDVVKTVGVASTAHLYLYGETNQDVPPESVIDGYRIGARENDTLRALVSYAGSVTEYSARIVMDGSTSSYEKVFTVRQSATGINSIGATYGNGANIITLTQGHSFLNGESVRVISDTGQLPDGLSPNNVYYTITGLAATTDIKLAKTLNEALNGTALTINEKGGVLKVVSRVSDKVSGDIGHPIQYDSTQGQWYIRVATASTENTLYSNIVGIGSTALGSSTSRTYFKRKSDNRSSTDLLYRIRYVIPKTINASKARPPSDGFIIQESNTSIGSTTGEILTYFGAGSLSNVNQQRNFRIISNATWNGSDRVDVTTELPHNLIVGTEVELVNVTSTTNTAGVAGTSFNRKYVVTGIGSAKHFSVGLTTNPGTFTNDTTARNTSLPYFKKKTYKDTLYVYRTQESQKYVSGDQDGIYYLTVLNASNTPTVTPFTNEKYSQPVKDLFPQINRDNPVSDPEDASCFASSATIGEVVVNDVRKSITKETLTKIIRDTDVGVGITNIISQTGTAHTIHTTIDHGLNRITRASVTNVGAGYSDGTYYNVKLVGIGTSTTGKYATAKVTVSSNAIVASSIRIMDGGSAYGIGNTLNFVGIPTTGSGSFTEGVATVDKIYNNVGDTLRIVGVSSEGYAGYNQLYRITGVNVGSATSLNAESVSSVVGFDTVTGVGTALCANSYFYLTGEAIRISNLAYDNVSGIATVTTSNNHGLKVDQKVKLVGFNQSEYTGDFVVTEILDTLTTPTYKFAVNLGIGTTAPSPTGAGTTYVYRLGYTSNDGVITENDENLGGRMIPTYAGITTTLGTTVSDVTSPTITITNLINLDVKIGDYLLIDDEIVRVKTTVDPSDTSVSVFRGVLGTKPATHTINSLVRKIFVNPTELRRHSINRASGHTFEYVGFGPGNYSTAFPDKQDRTISAQEELLSQSTKRSAGINFYTGMNDRGVSYSGNKKLSSVTGQEEIFDTPIQTITGEDIGTIPNINVTNALEGVFSRAVRVDGGTDNKVASEFNGPVVINKKLTVNSSVEGNNLFLQGDATVSRRYTVGIATPALAGNPGDIVYNANPTSGGYVGWIYTLENDWKRFGNVSISKDINIGIFDQVGIATTNPGNSKLLVGSGTTQFSIDGDGGVGIGTTANNYKLQIIGNTNISGVVTASYFVGDGSLLSNVNLSAAGWTQISGGLYNTSLSKVGIGTSVPNYNLEVGHVGIASTAMYVHGEAKFVGLITSNNVHVGGALTAIGNYKLENVSSGLVRASSIGIGTTNPLQSFQVGTANTLGISTQVFVVTGIGSVGIGTTRPRAVLDVDGHTRFKTYSEVVGFPTVSSNIVEVDLSQAQTFICTATANINEFRLLNAPSGSTQFTLRIDQDSTGSRIVGIDTFKTAGGSATIPVYWPGGGVLPVVTSTASRSDIYSFKVFDGDNLATAGIYGVVVGQNFAN